MTFILQLAPSQYCLSAEGSSENMSRKHIRNLFAVCASSFVCHWRWISCVYETVFDWISETRKKVSLSFLLLTVLLLLERTASRVVGRLLVHWESITRYQSMHRRIGRVCVNLVSFCLKCSIHFWKHNRSLSVCPQHQSVSDIRSCHERNPSGAGFGETNRVHKFGQGSNALNMMLRLSRPN